MYKKTTSNVNLCIITLCQKVCLARVIVPIFAFLPSHSRTDCLGGPLKIFQLILQIYLEHNLIPSFCAY